MVAGLMFVLAVCSVKERNRTDKSFRREENESLGFG